MTEATGMTDPLGEPFDRRQLSADVRELFDKLPEQDRASIARIQRPAEREFMIRTQSVNNRLEAGHTDVDLTLFVRELTGERSTDRVGAASGGFDWDRFYRSARDWSSMLILAKARVVGVPTPEERAAIEARAVAILDASEDDTERCFAICLLWTLKHVGVDAGLSPRADASLAAALKGDVIPVNMAYRMLRDMGMARERLAADFRDELEATGGRR